MKNYFNKLYLLNYIFVLILLISFINENYKLLYIALTFSCVFSSFLIGELKSKTSKLNNATNKLKYLYNNRIK